MKPNKIVAIIFIAIFLITLSITRFLIIDVHNRVYIKISKEEKDQISSVIEKCKLLKPDLQSSEVNVSWTDKGINEQMQLMNNILGSLDILGESKNGQPRQYYRAAYFPDQVVFIYIEKLEKSPNKTIIIEIQEHFYAAETKREYVDAVIDYLLEQGVY